MGDRDGEIEMGKENIEYLKVQGEHFKIIDWLWMPQYVQIS